MLNNQNLEENISKLKAQRALYSSAKILTGVQLILNVVVVILISITVLLFSQGWVISSFGWNKGDYAWVLAAYSFFIVFFDALVISKEIDRRKEIAAKIQQGFDKNVLNLTWNKSFYGEGVDNETVIEWSRKYKGDESGLTDWYSLQTNVLPSEIGRVICQRANCYWDSKVRGNYNTYLYVIGAVLTGGMISVSLFMNISVQNLFSMVLAPVIPFYLFAIKIISDNKKAISRLKGILGEANNQWEDILVGNYSQQGLKEFSNSIQHSIFLNRKESPLIFDFIYDFSKDDNENIMNRSADELISEYQNSQSSAG